jgi:hypothetical protein
MNRLLASFILFVPAAVFAMGCGTSGAASGGGWLPSATDATKKATFGFHASCDGADHSTAQFTYRDQGANVNIRVNDLLEDGSGTPACGVTTDFSGSAFGGGFIGTYTTAAGASGIAEVLYVDNGLAGRSNDDAIAVVLSGGVYDGYINVNTVSHGNIQFVIH